MVIAMSSNTYVINAYSGFSLLRVCWEDKYYCVGFIRCSILLPHFLRCTRCDSRLSLTHTHTLPTALSCVHHGNLSYSRIYIVVYGFYLPGVQPTEWNVGDSVPLFMNSLTSVVTHLPMGYESIKVGTISRAFQIVFISYIVYLA